MVLNFSEILNECGVETEPPEYAVKKLACLEEFYNSEEIVDIYNYILTHIKNYEILSGVIKLSDSHKSSVTLSILLDILLKKCANLEDNDESINLRALCAKEISNYRDNSTLGVLLFCLNNKDENYKVRLACADALGRIGDKYAVKPRIDVMQDD